ncbi:hypothetical protein F5X99DRAFT_414652 [Biscogniauxia marginata]|nr:hypothetical protein F5X99DRAFT_414652 [Biscogniauxia marginata]
MSLPVPADAYGAEDPPDRTPNYPGYDRQSTWFYFSTESTPYKFQQWRARYFHPTDHRCDRCYVNLVPCSGPGNCEECKGLHLPCVVTTHIPGVPMTPGALQSAAAQPPFGSYSYPDPMDFAQAGDAPIFSGFDSSLLPGSDPSGPSANGEQAGNFPGLGPNPFGSIDLGPNPFGPIDPGPNPFGSIDPSLDPLGSLGPGPNPFDNNQPADPSSGPGPAGTPALPVGPGGSSNFPGSSPQGAGVGPSGSGPSGSGPGVPAAAIWKKKAFTAKTGAAGPWLYEL